MKLMGEERSNDPPASSIGRQGVLYLLVGASSALIEILTFQTLFTLGIFSIEFSNIIAVVVSTIYNFLLNGRVTFKAQGNKFLCLVKYLALFFFNLCFTTIMISWLVSIGWSSLVAKLFTMCCVVLWNFVLYRKFVFA